MTKELKLMKCTSDLLLAIADGVVTFSYKDYRDAAATKEMTLEALEFIRRFSLHILPKAFVRIRHYGILSSTSKAACAVVIKRAAAASNTDTKSSPKDLRPTAMSLL